MAKDDIVTWTDIPTALGLLTRLPIRVDTHAAIGRGARAAWAWPVVGLIVGVLAALAGVAALRLGLTPAVAAGLVLAVQIIVTGAMHEDGLADSADGLWGGWDKARRLEIMHDSRIGTYGVLALILSVGLRWSALQMLISFGLLWPALILSGMLSRLPMLALLHALPAARADGLGRSVGVPPRSTVMLGTGIALGGTLLLVGPWALPLALTVGAISLGWANIAMAKIGGQTGDILGAVQQLAEITVLLTLLALVS